MLFNVTVKSRDTPDEELEKIKKTAISRGGTIRHEYKLIKGFTVEFPDDQVQTLEGNEHVHVELDGEVKTKNNQ